MTNPKNATFPFEHRTGAWSKGLTKREYFAALAMQGFVANPHAYCEMPPEDQCKMAVLYADELIEALNK